MPKPDSEETTGPTRPLPHLRTLGRGGMGVVYQGVNLQTEERWRQGLGAGFHHDTEPANDSKWKSKRFAS